MRAKRSAGTCSRCSAEGSGQADGLPRDHAQRDPRSARQSARPRHEARRGARRPAHPRPSRRLGDVAGALARLGSRPGRVGGTRAERRGAHGRGARNGCACGSTPVSGTTSKAPSSRRNNPFRAARRTRRQAPRRGARLRSRTGGDPPPARGERRRAARRRACRSACEPPPRTCRTVSSVESDPFTERPRAPFTTSTLQQESGRKLRFTASRTMAVAQRLYERATSPTCEPTAPTCRNRRSLRPRAAIREQYGDEYLPAEPRVPQEGEERAGSARGDTARRGSHPHAR